jgi:hypothetical protein
MGGGTRPPGLAARDLLRNLHRDRELTRRDDRFSRQNAEGCSEHSTYEEM